MREVPLDRWLADQAGAAFAEYLPDDRAVAAALSFPVALVFGAASLVGRVLVAFAVGAVRGFRLPGRGAFFRAA